MLTFDNIYPKMYSIIGDFMKKLLFIILLIILTLGLCSCGASPEVVLDNSENSRFIDFYTEDGYVYIECELNIYAEADAKVRITATDIEDRQSGLLKSDALTGIDKTDGDELFSLKKGEQKVTVLFRGEYGGVFLLTQREIPRFINIETE